MEIAFRYLNLLSIGNDGGDDADDQCGVRDVKPWNHFAWCPADASDVGCNRSARVYVKNVSGRSPAGHY